MKQYRTPTEKKCASLLKKFAPMAEFETSNEMMHMMEFDRLFNILTNISSVVLTIDETIQKSYEEFGDGEFLQVKDLIQLMYLYYHLTKQITKVSIYISENFDEEGKVK